MAHDPYLKRAPKVGYTTRSLKDPKKNAEKAKLFPIYIQMREATQTLTK